MGLKFPRWFRIGSIVHCILLILGTLVSVVMILNALLDMGEKDFEGKGLVIIIAYPPPLPPLPLIRSS